MGPIDLTLTVSEALPAFPGSPGPQFIPWSDLEEDGYNLELLFLSSHTGTHMDAPYHFADGGARIHEIPVGRLLGSALLVRARKGANRAVTKRDLLAFERDNGKIPDGASVFFHTGWQEFLKSDGYFAENPGLSERAAEYLASKKANMVGIDSPSIDCGNSRRFPAHRALSRNGVLIVENLANLDRIPGSRFDFAVLPLKLKGATGSPVRAVAF